MKHVVHLGEKAIVLVSKDLDTEELDMDSLTYIDSTNILGEIVTCSVLLNKVGLLRAEASRILELKKLDCKTYKSKLKRQLRREALLNGGKVKVEDEGIIKLTEATVDVIVDADLKLQAMEKELIESQKDFEYIESLFWSIQSKDKKLTGMTPKVTPEEFFDELIEGRINTFVIKKEKK